MKSTLALSSLLLFLSSSPIRADAVITTDATKFGRVVLFDSQGVTLRSGCTGGSQAIIPWSDVLLLKIDSTCRPHDVLPNPAGLERCGQKRVRAFKVLFRGSGPAFFAFKVALKENGKVYLVSLADETGISGALKEIESIQPMEVCRESIGENSVRPQSFCFESRKFAVNWSPEPVFSNRVFTRGSSIYIEGIGDIKGVTAEEIRFAYQTALSLWAIALQEKKSQLSAEVQKFIQQSTSSGGQFRLFTPPQVILVDCPDNALAVVRWYAERRDAFPSSQRSYIAKAQVQGRTVLLNANDNVFAVGRNSGETVSPGQTNLMTVFLHELGHSFGLPDNRHTEEPSVMDPAYVVDNIGKTLSPSAQDTFALARVLESSIKGAAPGVLTAERCAGLRRSSVAPAVRSKHK